MRLADFIEQQRAAIVEAWEDFAASLFPADGLTPRDTLRDHADEILQAIVLDLRTPQSAEQQQQKSLGQALRLHGAPRTAAETHAILRAASGFTMQQLVAEYRALRASVLRLWFASQPHDPQSMDDVCRFNEAIDQAVAESVEYFSAEVERWRNIFLGVLGHDLRGPLNAIMLTSQLISRLSHDSPIGHTTERLIRSGERMKELLDDLLDYSRTRLDIGIVVSREPVDLAAVCAEEIELQKAARPGIDVQLHTAGDVTGPFDGSRVRQIVGNLVSNAAAHGRQGLPIAVRLVGDRDEVRLAVENRGDTLSPQALQQLFEPLRRLGLSEDPRDSTHLGLGLFIVRQIALAHGGNVKVQSADGRTVFEVNLPKC